LPTPSPRCNDEVRTKSYMMRSMNRLTSIALKGGRSAAVIHLNAFRIDGAIDTLGILHSWQRAGGNYGVAPRAKKHRPEAGGRNHPRRPVEDLRGNLVKIFKGLSI
jgi:hypothetical protein